MLFAYRLLFTGAVVCGIVVIRRPLRRAVPRLRRRLIVFISAQVDSPAAVLHAACCALAAEIEAAVYFVLGIGISGIYGAAALDGIARRVCIVAVSARVVGQVVFGLRLCVALFIARLHLRNVSARVLLHRAARTGVLGSGGSIFRFLNLLRLIVTAVVILPCALHGRGVISAAAVGSIAIVFVGVVCVGIFRSIVLPVGIIGITVIVIVVGRLCLAPAARSMLFGLRLQLAFEEALQMADAGDCGEGLTVVLLTVIVSAG